MSFLEKISDDSTIKGRIIITSSIVIGLFVIVFVPMLIGIGIVKGCSIELKEEYYGPCWVLGFMVLSLPILVFHLLYSFIHWIITGD